MLGGSNQGGRDAIATRIGRRVAALILMGIIANFVPTAARAAGPTSPGTSWIVMSVASGKVIAEHDPDTLRYPASLTKLMTLDLAFDALVHGRLSMATRLPVSVAAADVPPVKLNLRAGQTISVRDAMLGMTTFSANDAATALGEYLGGGSMARFASAATREAHALGMLETRFTNSSGLPDPNQVTDAYDMALLARHILLTYPQYDYLFAAKGFHFQGNWVPNIDGMLTRYPGAIGMKTGFTDLARFNLVTAARRNGHLLIGVELHAPSWSASYDKMTDLLNQGFADVAHTVVAANDVPSAPARPQVEAPIRDAVSHQLVPIRQAAEEIDAGQPVMPNPPAGWAAQVGSYDNYAAALRQAAHIHHMRGIGVVHVGSMIVHGRRLWRAELAGLDQAGARYTCHMMQRYHESCFTIPPRRDVVALPVAAPAQVQLRKVAYHPAATSAAVAHAGISQAVVRRVVPGWIAQVGAYDTYVAAQRQALHIHQQGGGIGIARVSATKGRGRQLWRAEIAGLDYAGAQRTCQMMQRDHESCFVRGPVEGRLAMR